jgi:hypothetical protein
MQTSLDFIRSHPELTAAECARELGISRQRVSQLVATYGVQLKDGNKQLRVNAQPLDGFYVVRYSIGGGGPQYWNGGLMSSATRWTRDLNAAVWFVREQDARKIMRNNFPRDHLGKILKIMPEQGRQVIPSSNRQACKAKTPTS